MPRGEGRLVVGLICHNGMCDGCGFYNPISDILLILPGDSINIKRF